jgi:segregation and condensation protein B
MNTEHENETSDASSDPSQMSETSDASTEMIPSEEVSPEMVPSEANAAEITSEEVFGEDLSTDPLGEESDVAGESESMFPLAEELRLEAQIEAVVFASPKPMRTTEIFDLLQAPGVSLNDIQQALDGLVETYRDRAGGFHLRYIKRMGYQFQTVPAAARIMERQFAARPRPISRAAMETLAIIAYRQPVTRADVEFIRGVDAGSIMKGLLERNLITCVGRKEIAGRPMMFGTTDEFLKVFQIGSVKDLPPLESFQPPAEVLEGAMDKLTGESGEPVDIEDFIGDEEYAEQRQGASVAPLDEEDSAAAAQESAMMNEENIEPVNHEEPRTEEE